ncbi:MAG: hypothetical protein IIX39_02895 [Clostridia bacterium]|nr:hypothetical protein [Clostridia bacterium]
MANNNNNDYNYYKSEYGKFKNNYYTPGNNNKNNKKRGNKAVKRFFRAFFVFLFTFSIIAVAVFGGIKLYKNISANKPETPSTSETQISKEDNTSKTEKETTEKETTEKETTTKKEESTTKKEENTTKKPSSDKISAGSVGYVSTGSGEPIYLRHEPTYNISGYAPLTNGTRVVISEISSDGKWGKTSNFDINGWVYLQYIKVTASASSNSSSATTQYYPDKLSFSNALEIFGKDTSKNLYMNCSISSSEKVKGIADYNNPDSAVISTFSDGQKVEIYSVRNGYGKTRINNVETWIPTRYLEFDSWGHYR